MFKVTVSEKNGPEREMFFEDEEVSIGRLQGNSVVLPKPNVSKRHATVIFKDGKTTIVDQQSTNGTYINGRRISSPKELVKGDRIYIGDYTIRCFLSDEAEESQASAEMETLSAEDQRKATVAVPALPPDDELSRETPLPVDLDVEIVTEEVTGMESGLHAEDSPIHIPEIPPELVEEAVEAVEAIESGSRSEESAVPKIDLSDLEEELAGGLPEIELTPVPAAVDEPSPVPEPAPSASTSSTGLSQRLKKVVRPEDPEGSDRHLEALRLVAVQAMIEIFASVPSDRSDFADDEWEKLSDSVLRLVDRMRREEIIPSDVDPYTISQDLLFEFTGLGPLEELLGDENIRRIMVDGPNRVFVVRQGGSERVNRSFVSPETMDRVVAKLSGLAGLSAWDQPVLEGRLPDGTSMMILQPPLTSDRTAMVFERPLASRLTTDDLVDAEVMSKDVRDAIEGAVKDHHSVLICGPHSSGRSIFLNSVVQQIPEEDRVVVIERRKELTLPHGNVVNLNKDFILADNGPGPSISTRLFPDVIVLSELEADDARILTALGLAGQKGLIMTTLASSVETCLQRMELMMAIAHPSMDTGAIQILVRKSAELIVVLELGGDGRSHVIEAVLLDKKGKFKPIES